MTRRLTEKNALMHAGRVGQVRRRRPRGARPHARHRRLRQHRHPAVRAGREPRHVRSTSTTPPTSWRSATPGAARPLTELLERGDVVTLHVDGRASTRACSARPSSPRCGRVRCSSTCPAASSSTTPRCAAHIESGHIAGAAVDVFPVEPKGRGDEFVSELRGLPNVILTPHIGGSTEEAQQDIGRFVAGKLRDFVARRRHRDEREPARPGAAAAAGHPPPRPPPPQRAGRPGTVNGLLAEHKVNVEAQLLGTRGELGYVVTDIVHRVPRRHARPSSQTCRRRSGSAS